MIDIKLMEWLALMMFAGIFTGIIAKATMEETVSVEAITADHTISADSVKISTPDFVIEED